MLSIMRYCNFKANFSNTYNSCASKMLPTGCSLGFPHAVVDGMSPPLGIQEARSLSGGSLHYKLKDEGKKCKSVCISNLALLLEAFNLYIQSQCSG